MRTFVCAAPLRPPPPNLVSNFLTTPLAELRSVNGDHPIRGPRMKHSVTTYLERASDGDAEFSKLAVAHRPGHS
jgi:hypothetical protein